MARTQLQHVTDVADEELNLSWATVAALVTLLAGRLLLEGTASLAEIATIAGSVAVVVASAFIRIRQWTGFWFLWAAFLASFAFAFASVGGLVPVALVVVAGVLVVCGIQELRGELER